MKETFTVSTIARIVKVSERTLIRSILNGELSAIKKKQWHILFSDAANFVYSKTRQKWGKP